jgi:hypothetical protein
LRHWNCWAALLRHKDPDWISWLNAAVYISLQEEWMAMPEKTDKTKRETYTTPKLVTYGDIAEITRHVGATGMMDWNAVMKTALP